MSLTPKTKHQNISAKISACEKEIAKEYIKGAVHGFCNNLKNEHFSVRILFGGDNWNWNGTPLQNIYDYHFHKGKDTTDAKNRAAIDVGHLLKEVLEEDRRKFKQDGEDTGKLYKLVVER